MSHATALPEFDLFSVPPTQLSVAEDIETEQRPINIIKPDSREFTFEFVTAPDEYVSFRETELYLRLRFVLPAGLTWMDFTTEVNFMHTLIQSIDVSINDTPVTRASQTYAWRAFFETAPHASTDAVEGWLSSAMVVPEFQSENCRYMPSIPSLLEGPWFELRGKLKLDLSQQCRAILGGCKYTIKFQLNRGAFVFNVRPESYVYEPEARHTTGVTARGFKRLSETSSSQDVVWPGKAKIARYGSSDPVPMQVAPSQTGHGVDTDGLIRVERADVSSTSSSTKTSSKRQNLCPEYELGDAVLIVHRAKVTPATLEAHRKALSTTPAKYPITRVEVKTLTINPGLSDITTEPIFSGQLPRRILVGLIPNEAVIGSPSVSSFRFEPHGVNYLAFTVDGLQYPRNAFKPDFQNNKYMREYYSLQQAFNLDSLHVPGRLSFEEYKDRVVLYAYNFAPDMSDGSSAGGPANLIKRGVLGMHMRFSEPPTKTLSAIVYAEFDNMIEIDKDGRVGLDYM